ncbi:MAG: hypothetical protein A2845_00145 [Candidatus Lloydbacteria bacterium RIFCSPHIGHO2_01_FULL_49_22]|uniref:Uncharacterized protein n=1 Tax=Candidatus Lloydbacteria bacterium RIFCSPHIGHO2_01_FULL_49_22 TaxID=1798658 RepID=A0A1G2CY63_9BACT|nr:MAG: hypothetical protein A2845_00145 [Candidatus Lloydbacteria bacterium RIFCSPHIGHO2_01_FULL_49_22]OGZ09278.1 MAG: hypothetical protein A3C14_05050 [Candidatus Lloydbacteria bacterium RIFCSPHIGHO2_02_FULL_50_18]
MKLYYYSIAHKKFKPLFRNSADTAENQKIDRFNSTSRGFLPIAWALWAGGSYVAAKLFGGAALDAAGNAALALLEMLAQAIFWAAGLFLEGCGLLLDMAIQSTIDSNMYSSLQVINVGWTTVRDFSNMFFIFALLYIAIKTILGMGGSSTKRWVANLILAAILINFSLFATKVVIDAGNVLAMGFWSKMEMGKVPGDSSAAQHLLGALKLQSIADFKDKDGNTIPGIQPINRILIYIGGALVMLVAGYVFLAGAIMMIIRTVTLIFLMIVSPFAFLSFALPVGGGFSQKWLSKLIGNAFVAPAFLAMLYLVIIIINGVDLNTLGGAKGLKWGAALAGDPGSLPIIYNYVLMIILLLASLTVANAVSAGAGDSGSRWAKRGLGYGAAAGFGAAGAVGRQTAGRAGRSKLQNEKWVAEQNKLIAKGGMKDAKIGDKFAARSANLKLAAAEKASKGTYDIRNAPMKGLGVGAALGAVGIQTGAGSKRSYATTGGAEGSLSYKGVGGYVGTENEKALIATAKARFPNDPTAQQAYLKQRGVDITNKPGEIIADAKRNDATRKELNKGIALAKSKEEIAEHAKAEKERINDIETKRTAAIKDAKTDEEKLAINKSADDEVIRITKEVSEEMKKAMQGLTSIDRAKLAEDHYESVAFARNLTKADLHAIQRKAVSEDGYKAGVTEKLTKSVAIGGREEVVNYMNSPEGKSSLFEMGTIQESDMKNYQRNIARAAKTKSGDALKIDLGAAKLRSAETEARLAAAKATGISTKIGDAQKAHDAAEASEKSIQDNLNKLAS